MTNRAVFFLHKGPLGRDSRSHIGLRHTVVAHQAWYKGAAGHPIEMAFTLTNTGQSTWLHVNDEIFGIVRLAAHLYEADGHLLSIDFFRHDLPRSVKPGETLHLTVPVVLPPPGRYRLAFDLVAEGVTWFENVGSAPALVHVDAV